MMNPARITIPAGKFKAQCLALLDQIAERGDTVVITKRGKPVARLVPIERTPRKSLRGSVLAHGEIVGPTGLFWQADQ